MPHDRAIGSSARCGSRGRRDRRLDAPAAARAVSDGSGGAAAADLVADGSYRVHRHDPGACGRRRFRTAALERHHRRGTAGDARGRHRGLPRHRRAGALVDRAGAATAGRSDVGHFRSGLRGFCSDGQRAARHEREGAVPDDCDVDRGVRRRPVGAASSWRPAGGCVRRLMRRRGIGRQLRDHGPCRLDDRRTAVGDGKSAGQQPDGGVALPRGSSPCPSGSSWRSSRQQRSTSRADSDLG